jgi:potassium-transporting ATPase KdpC subunit
MLRYLIISLRMMLVTAVLLGILYPLAMTGLAQLLFPHQANGSLIEKNGRVIGSSLIAQAFTSAKYFQPRPSAAGNGYDGMDSSFSNLGPTSKALIDRIRADVERQLAEDRGLRLGSVPVDMVTTSASGLDPDITVANALAQAQRVASARGISLQQVLALIAQQTTGRQLGFLGEPRVNVLELNLALDAAKGVVASR